MENTAWDPDGNRILILPSILAIISNQGINSMMLELEEICSGAGPDNDEEQE